MSILKPSRIQALDIILELFRQRLENIARKRKQYLDKINEEIERQRKARLEIVTNEVLRQQATKLATLQQAAEKVGWKLEPAVVLKEADGKFTAILSLGGTDISLGVVRLPKKIVAKLKRIQVQIDGLLLQANVAKQRWEKVYYYRTGRSHEHLERIANVLPAEAAVHVDAIRDMIKAAAEKGDSLDATTALQRYGLDLDETDLEAEESCG